MEYLSEHEKTEVEEQEKLEAVKERPSNTFTPHPLLSSRLEAGKERPSNTFTPHPLLSSRPEAAKEPSTPLPVHFPSPRHSTPAPPPRHSTPSPSPRTVRPSAPIPTPLPSPYNYRMDTAMTTPVVDVLVLTFNCGKAIADSNVLARHLRHAFARDAMAMTESVGHNFLPDVVVFSLQEIAPLTNGYLGGQFLSAYFNSFTEALNIGALEFTGLRRGVHRSQSTLSNIFYRQPEHHPYKLIESRNVGMTAIMLFARDPDAITHVEVAECAFGIANMGNKGAIALRVKYSVDRDEPWLPYYNKAYNSGLDGYLRQRGYSSREAAPDAVLREFRDQCLQHAKKRELFKNPDSSTKRVAEITFVATHLAAMEYNLRRRNANWASICSSCLFEDPLKFVPKEFHSHGPGIKNTIEASTSSSSTSSKGKKQTDGGKDIPPQTEEELRALSDRTLDEAWMSEELKERLHDISIFKRSSHLFVAGDLNYRISTTTPSATDHFPNLQNYKDFLDRDQLREEKKQGRTLHGLSEADINFPPTYKIKHLGREKLGEAVNKDEFDSAESVNRENEVIPWKWAPNRWPGWCDRVLYLDTPEWVQREHNTSLVDAGYHGLPVPKINVVNYKSLPTMITSDHAPVYLRATVPLLPPEELEATPSKDDNWDPRIKLPVPIDTGAFARRAAARRREVFAGATALFFSTREGAIMVFVIAAVGIGSYWLMQNQDF